jgi:demethylmenaquinone methyltransferase/2-methoxy-6-polyprenyl-1,4-benzoquinol methylase
MFSYIFMKILETRPQSYDRRMDQLSGGRAAQIKQSVADAVPQGARVLEIGCGTGQLAAMLCEQGATVEGFDANPAMVAQARRRIEAESLQDKLAVREMGVEGMDTLPERSFSAAVSTLVLSELSDDERRYALRHARRLLEPGGRLIIADEVVPRTAGRRLLHAAVRAPLLAATYLASRSSTRPLADLRQELADAGFVLDREERSHGDAFALFVAHRPSEEARP